MPFSPKISLELSIALVFETEENPGAPPSAYRSSGNPGGGGLATSSSSLHDDKDVVISNKTITDFKICIFMLIFFKSCFFY